MVETLQRSGRRRLILFSCWLSLAGLALMVCSVLVPKPLPVIVAMSLGQVLGAAALVGYGLGVLLDSLEARRTSGRPPPITGGSGSRPAPRR